jgi:hypothetical protein
VKKLFLVLALGGLASGANAVVLWDQLGATDYGFASQDFETAYDDYDCMVADDFEILESEWEWTISNIEFDMYLPYGDSAPVHGVNIRFMPARADNTGDYWNPVYTEVNPATTIYNGTNSLDLVTHLNLGAGHYFVGVAPQLDWEDYGQCYFLMNSFPVWNQMALMINPGGGWGEGADWFAPAPGYDASFRINGVCVPEPGVVPLAGLLLGAGAIWLRRR